jgi:hypothetical protein
LNDGTLVVLTSPAEEPHMVSGVSSLVSACALRSSSFTEEEKRFAKEFIMVVLGGRGSVRGLIYTRGPRQFPGVRVHLYARPSYLIEIGIR